MKKSKTYAKLPKHLLASQRNIFCHLVVKSKKKSKKKSVENIYWSLKRDKQQLPQCVHSGTKTATGESDIKELYYFMVIYTSPQFVWFDLTF